MDLSQWTSISQLLFDVKGIGNVITQQDITSKDVAQRFEDKFEKLYEVYQVGSSIGSSHAAEFWDAMADLKQLIENGMVAGDGKTYFVTYNMAGWYSGIRKALDDAGVADGSVDALKDWAVDNAKNQSSFGVTGILQAGAIATKSNHSLQAAIEIEYVGLANRILGANLESLSEALKNSNDALKLLQEVQQFHNMITIEVPDNSAPAEFVSKIAEDRHWGSLDIDSADKYLEEYRKRADSLYQNPLNPVVDVDPNTVGNQKSDSDLQPVREQFEDTRQRLKELIQHLTGQDPDSPSFPTQQPNSLPATLYSVYLTMKAVDGNTDTDKNKEFEKWILDNQQHGNASSGYLSEAIQQKITSAINAAESFNDQQKQIAQQQLFLFEEFYKSASALLSTINTIICNMAQSVNG